MVFAELQEDKTLHSTLWWSHVFHLQKVEWLYRIKFYVYCTESWFIVSSQKNEQNLSSESVFHVYKPPIPSYIEYCRFCYVIDPDEASWLQIFTWLFYKYIYINSSDKFFFSFFFCPVPRLQEFKRDTRCVFYVKVCAHARVCRGVGLTVSIIFQND